MKTIQTNTKPIDSQPMQVDIKRLANMGLLPLKKAKCFICKQEFVGIGHNPYPVIQTEFFKSARCCDTCNDEKVIAARILEKHYQDTYGSEMGSKCIINLIHLGWSVEKTLRLFKHKQVA